MDGFLNVLKPPGMTSHDVVSCLRRALSIKRAGHLGTLDPGAGGVLPLAFGKATRLIEYINDSTKGYRAELTLGISTDTGDSFGKIMGHKNVGPLTAEQLQSVIDSFQGQIEQVPPAASAIRVRGKHLYEYYRKGIAIEAPPRKVVIESIATVMVRLPRVIIDVICSAGTYIRSLCADMGKALGCGAHMSFLVRFRSGCFMINDAYSIDEIIASKQNLYPLLTLPTKVLDDIPLVIVTGDSLQAVKHGSPAAFEKMDAPGLKDGDLAMITDSAGEIVAMGRVLSRESLVVRPLKVL
jgi:tRNA pseudouridine55 synthase